MGAGIGHLVRLKLTAMAMPAKILVVDDHPLFRDAIQSAITSEFPDTRIVEAASIEAALSVLKSGQDFDLVLLDLAMPGTLGFDGLNTLRSTQPKLPIVIVSAHEDAAVIHEAMICGASGFISKSVRRRELADAIRDVMNGVVTLPQNYRPPEACAATTDAASEALQSLTPQQARVLQMIRQGLLNKQIAHELGVGETTIKAHVSEILRKLGVASRTQAVIEATRLEGVVAAMPASLARLKDPRIVAR
jgi:DNA-binding NarL/FixJ family response regulator